MHEDDTDPPRVLVIEDERHLADLYAEYLTESYDVVTAYGGSEGLERLSEDVDVVVLDRRMPVLSGNEVLATIEERDVDCRVAMVTAVDPEFDIIELGVDDYVVKPVTAAELVEVVDRLVRIVEYEERLTELTSKKLTRNVLKVEKSRRELARSERFQELQEEIWDLESTVEALGEQLNVAEENIRL